MGRPPGAKNKPKNVVTADSSIVQSDGYAEAMTANTRPSPAAVGYAGAVGLMTEREAIDLYMSDGFARRVVDIPAEEMTRAGFELEGLSDELQKKVQARVEELDLLRIMNDAMRWSRLLGGSVIVIGVDDGGALDQPLNDNRAKGVDFLRVYDRWEATALEWEEDALQATYGEPVIWQIAPKAGGTYKVHNSRLLRFDGDALPNIYRQVNLGWGASVLQACRSQLSRLGMAHVWSNAILERSQQAIHGIPNLGAIMQQRDGEESLKRRVALVDMVRSIMNTVVIDAQETYDIKSVPVMGAPDIMDRFAEALSAVTAIPVYLLMGRSPGGLNATGASNETAWYDRVSAMQNDILRRPLDRLLSLIVRGINGTDGGDYRLCFKSLKTQNDTERADIRSKESAAEKSRADAFAEYVSSGIMSVEEVREQLADEYGLQPDAEITPPAVEAANILAAHGTPTGAPITKAKA